MKLQKKPKKRVKHLDYDHLREIVRCIETIDSQLDKLHWQTCSFMDPQSPGDVIKNIKKYRYKLDKAKEGLYRLFESQYDDAFEPVKK